MDLVFSGIEISELRTYFSNPSGTTEDVWKELINLWEHLYLIHDGFQKLLYCYSASEEEQRGYDKNAFY